MFWEIFVNALLLIAAISVSGYLIDRALAKKK